MDFVVNRYKLKPLALPFSISFWTRVVDYVSQVAESAMEFGKQDI